MTNSYLSVTELSAFIKLSKSTIYKKTSLNQIPFIKTGKNLLFKVDQIELWLENQSQPTVDEISMGIVNILKKKKWVKVSWYYLR